MSSIQEEDIPSPVSEIQEDIPLLKPKKKRNMTDEQRLAARERMIKVNNERIANAQYTKEKEKEINKLKMIQRKQNIEDKLDKLQKEVKEKEKPNTDIKKKPKKSIKIVNIESSDYSDSSYSDDESIPEGKLVIINKTSKSKSKPKMNNEEKPYKKVEPVQIKTVHKFL